MEYMYGISDSTVCFLFPPWCAPSIERVGLFGTLTLTGIDTFTPGVAQITLSRRLLTRKQTPILDRPYFY